MGVSLLISMKSTSDQCNRILVILNPDCMMTSSNGNIFGFTGHLCREFTGHRWIPCTKASDAELWCLFYYTPHFNEVERGVYWYHLVRLSVCPSVRPSVCPSVDKIVSALYLQQYSSDPFHICTSYQATKEGVSHVMPVSKFINLKFWRIF